MAATKRITKELSDLTANPPTGYTITPPEANLFLWSLTLVGPPSTPFESGKFQLGLTLPPNYPFAPPTLTFLTKIYHPNVSSSSNVSGVAGMGAGGTASSSRSGTSGGGENDNSSAGAGAGGAMCLPMLRADQWKPASRITGVLEAARQLLVEPNIDDAIETDIADIYKNDRKKWEKTAKEWCKRYAS